MSEARTPYPGASLWLAWVLMPGYQQIASDAKIKVQTGGQRWSCDLVIVGQWDIKGKPVWLCLICVGLETEKGPSDPRVPANEEENCLSDVSLCNCYAVWKPNSSRLSLQQGSLKCCRLPCSFTKNGNKRECKGRCVCCMDKWVIIGFHLKHTSWVSQFC